MSTLPCAAGARLTDAAVTIFREGDVSVSALTGGYNAGLPCYQQWPWAVNLGGIPLWCACGLSGTGGLSCLGNRQASTELSSSRVMPSVSLDGRRLVADYTPRSWTVQKGELVMRWPVTDLDETGAFSGGWIWARKGNACVAYRYDSRYIISLVVWDRRVITCPIEIQ
jgi:hypothetical protein